MRVEKSLKNFIYGCITQAVSSLLGFVVRYALVYTLGVEAVSLNGLFTEVIAMLSLAEMGVGTAIVYHLYVPLREKDEEKLAQLMNLYRSAYRIIALAILLIGLAILPWIHLLVSRMEVDLSYLRLIYFLFLVQTAVSYLFSYKTALFGADQRGYVTSRCMLLVRVVFTGISIVFLLATRNFIVYLLVQIAMTLSGNILISFQADKYYPFLRRKDKLPGGEKKEIFSNIRNIFIGVLSGKITNSTDNILISLLVGTLHIGAYSCYTMIINALNSLLIQIHHATTGGIGNLVSEQKHEHTEEVLRRLTFVTYCPTVLAAVGIYTVSTPFILLLYGEEYLLPMPVVLVCTMNFMIYLVKNPLWSVMAASGMFERNRNISLIGDGMNLVISVLLGKRLGIAGILLGTSATLLVQWALKVRLLFKRSFRLPGKRYVFLVVRLLLTGLGCMLASYAVCERLPVQNRYLQIPVYGVCTELLTLGVNVLVFFRTPEFEYMKTTGKNLLEERVQKKTGGG